MYFICCKNDFFLIASLAEDQLDSSECAMSVGD